MKAEKISDFIQLSANYDVIEENDNLYIKADIAPFDNRTVLTISEDNDVLVNDCFFSLSQETILEILELTKIIRYLKVV